MTATQIEHPRATGWAPATAPLEELRVVATRRVQESQTDAMLQEQHHQPAVEAVGQVLPPAVNWAKAVVVVRTPATPAHEAQAADWLSARRQ
jgi:hypothetical protein